MKGYGDGFPRAKNTGSAWFMGRQDAGAEGNQYAAFCKGEMQIMVSTTVIEVGVNKI